MNSAEQQKAFMDELAKAKAKFGLSGEVTSSDIARIINEGKDKIEFQKSKLSREDRIYFPLYALALLSWSKAEQAIVRYELTKASKTFFYQLSLLYASLLMARKPGLVLTFLAAHRIIHLYSLSIFEVEGKDRMVSVLLPNSVSELGLKLIDEGRIAAPADIEAMIKEDLEIGVTADDQEDGEPDEDPPMFVHRSQSALLILISLVGGIFMAFALKGVINSVHACLFFGLMLGVLGLRVELVRQYSAKAKNRSKF